MRSNSGSRIPFLLFLLFVLPVHAQDAGTAATEFYGRGVAISVVVHGSSGQPISSSAMVKVFRGTIPAGQAETNNGRAEVFVNDLGDFTVIVEAAGYASAQKDVSINANGRADVDLYLHSSSVNLDGVPGRPLLAPKAKKAVEEAFEAIGADNLTKAQKHASQAVHLSPGHPDVLYLQGVIFLKQRDWSKAQEVLEKATQIDPSHANAFAALGMALCDQGKYDAAVAPLEKALQLNPARSSWDARWALAKAYYRQARYDQALQMSQVALSLSEGKAPRSNCLWRNPSRRWAVTKMQRKPFGSSCTITLTIVKQPRHNVGCGVWWRTAKSRTVELPCATTSPPQLPPPAPSVAACAPG